jgi:hypothetical protein
VEHGAPDRGATSGWGRQNAPRDVEAIMPGAHALLAQQTRRARLRHACFEASEAINLTTRNVTRSSFRARTTGAESLELLPLAGLSFIASARQHCSRMCRMQVLAMRLSIARIQLFLCGGSNLAVLIVGKQQQSQKAAPEDVRGIQSPDHPR